MSRGSCTSGDCARTQKRDYRSSVQRTALAAWRAACILLGLTSQAAVAASVTYTYDDTGRLKMVTYGNGTQVTYSLDAAGNRSNVATTFDTTPPGAPGGLTASAVTGSQVTLTWSPATDNFAVAYYQVERCQGSGCSNFGSLASSGGTAYTDSGLAQVTSYSYRVRAVDPAGNLGAYSAVVTAVTLDVTPPSAPGGLSAGSITGSQITLSWSASSDNVGVAGYRLERCQGSGCGGFAQIATSGSTSYTDSGLHDVTTYSYRVRAFDAAGNLSGYSAVVAATTLDATPPSVPTGLVATTVSSSQINIAWNGSSDNVGVAGYRIYRCTGSGCGSFAQVGSTGATSYADTGLTNNTIYTYAVAAYDAAGNVSGLSGAAAAIAVDPVTASVSTTTWDWVKVGGRIVEKDPAVVVTAHGGSGSYSYSWIKESGDASTAAASPSSNSTTWTADTATLAPNSTYVSVWHCLVTDSAGRAAYGPDVTVTFERDQDCTPRGCQ